MFRKLCGAEKLRNVLLVSSKWDVVQEERGAEQEKELCSEETFWKSMIIQGATVLRYNNRTVTAMNLIQTIVSNNPSALKIQKQLVDDQVPLVKTDAGEDVNGEIHKAKRYFHEELVAIREEHDAVIESSMTKALQLSMV